MIIESIFVIFSEICRHFAVINSRYGIVRFFFANLVLLVIKAWLILFGWYVIAYATVQTPLILASLKKFMSIFVMVSLLLTDIGISILMFRPLFHFFQLFSISRGILLCYGILKSQRFRNSILPINSTGDINPNVSRIQVKVLSTFILFKIWLSVDISTLNVSFCLSQFKPSILVSLAFVSRCSFAKFNSV